MNPITETTPPRRKNSARWLLLVLAALVFAASQDRYLMRRLFMRHGGGHETVHWAASFADATALAQREQRPLYLDFSATWCGPCQEMLAETYTDPDVAHRLNTQFIPVLLDVDKQHDLADRYGVSPIPDGVFLSPDGRQIARSIGFHDPDEFLTIIDKAQEANDKLPPAPHSGAFVLPSAAPPAPPLMP